MNFSPVVKAVRDHMRWPLLLGLGALALFWLMARLDGAQSARLAELDQQQQAVVEATLSAAKARRALRVASEATDRENARLRAQIAARDANLRRLAHRADSLTATLQPVLAGLPDSVSHPLLTLLALKDTTIAEQAATIADLRLVADSLQADRDRWRSMDERDAQLAADWQATAGRWEKEAKKNGCHKLLGLVPLPDIGVGAAAVYGEDGKFHYGPAVTLSYRLGCLVR